MENDGGLDHGQLCQRLKDTDPSLTQVSLSDRIDSSVIDALTSNSVVDSVDIQNSDLGDAIATALATMPALTRIKVRNVGLSSIGARTLSSSSAWANLQSLDLSDNRKLGPRGIQPLAANLALAKDLEELNLSNCRIGHFGAKAIGECRLPAALKVLDLSDNGIGNDGAWKLAPSLDELTSLESLLLSKNQIGDDGAGEIAHHLPSSLKVLVLRDNDVADVGVEAIALALSKLHPQTLVLANNSIGSSGCTSLSRLIINSSSLEEIDLNGNAIGDVGAAALAESLEVKQPMEGDDELARKTPSLITLLLRDNQIGDEGAGAFVEHLDRNQTLTALDLAGNKGISAARFHILDLMLKHRTPRRAPLTGDGALTPPMSPIRQDQSDETVLKKGRKALQSSHAVEVSTRFVELVTDNFDLERILSYGAFGESYQVTDTENQYVVQRTPLNQTEEKRNVRELALKDTLELRHSNVMPIKAYSKDVNCFCFVYECDCMLSLDKIVSDCAKRKKLTWKSRLEIVLGIASALDFLHNGRRRSRFHGDVKSANIYVTNDCTAKLVDCGIAQLVATDEQRFQSDDVVFGSRGYRCPRYERGSRKYTPESDVFSFGIVMAELCTGRLQNDIDGVGGQRRDFYYDYVVDKKLEMTKDLDESAGQYDPKVLATIGKITMSCMDSEPMRRPGTSSIVRLMDNILKR